MEEQIAGRLGSRLMSDRGVGWVRVRGRECIVQWCSIGFHGTEPLESTTWQSSQKYGLRVKRTGFNVTIVVTSYRAMS